MIKIKIEFLAEYPFKPPKIRFLTIYHPNIDEKGQVYLPIISAEKWKPATKTDQVIQAQVVLVHDPEPEHPLRVDFAEEYTKDKEMFYKNAEEFTMVKKVPVLYSEGPLKYSWCRNLALLEGYFLNSAWIVQV